METVLVVSLASLVLVMVGMGVMIQKYRKLLWSTVDSMKENHEQGIQELNKNHGDQLEQYGLAVRDLRRGYQQLIAKLQQDFNNVLAKLHSRAGELQKTNESLLRAATGAVYHMARLRANMRDGEDAARWLFVVNCMGAWTPSDPEQAKVVARGQLAWGMNPTGLDTMLKSVVENTPSEFLDREYEKFTSIMKWSDETLQQMPGVRDLVVCNLRGLIGSIKNSWDNRYLADLDKLAAETGPGEEPAKLAMELDNGTDCCTAHPVETPCTPV